MPGMGLPAELRSVRGKLLEDYVRSRILEFAKEQSFAKRLYASPARVYSAAKETLEELARPSDFGGARNLRLVFRHTCLSLGCLNGDCGMCTNTPHRRCATTFAPKYLSGDAVKAKCGASIFVEAVDEKGEPAHPDITKGLHLEICILEGKSYSEADPDTITDAFLDANTLLVDSKGKEVLGPGRGCERTENKKVLARFQNSKAELSVNILGSSIAMLTGQKPPFRLLVRAIDSETGQRARGVNWTVSEAFVVATQRVKGAQKAEIPHVEEHVSKIENVGVQTQHKLLDVRAAALAAGITGLTVIHNTVNTVGQFRDLVESTAKDMPLQETLRKVLNFTSKGWEAAKAHALKAVETDNRMRIWLADDAHSRGLLFRCNLGRIDLDSPVGVLTGSGRQHSDPGSYVDMDAILMQHPSYDRQEAAWMQQQAVECWWRLGHPGWSIWPADSEQFIRNVCEAGDVCLPPVQISAPAPATKHSSALARALTLTENEIAGAHTTGTKHEAGLPPSNPTASRPLDANSAAEGSGRAALMGEKQSSESQKPGGHRASDAHRVSLFAQRPASPGPSTGSMNPPATSSGSQPSASANRSGSWTFKAPLVNGHSVGGKDSDLPMSPFDLPVASSGGTPASHPATIFNNFSFRPPTGSKGSLTNVNSNLPQGLPTLTTQDIEQLFELQRRLTNDSSTNADQSAQSALGFLTNLSMEYNNLSGSGDANFPLMLSRLSGLISDPNFAPSMESRPTGQNGQLFNSIARIQQQATQQQQDANDMRPPEQQGEGQIQMPLKMSGKVSGILDDLSDAMSMLHDLLPSGNSDLHLQGQGARSTTEDQALLNMNNFGGFPFSNLASLTSLPKAPPLTMLESAEGSNGLAKVTSGVNGDSFQLTGTNRKRPRPTVA